MGGGLEIGSNVKGIGGHRIDLGSASEGSLGLTDEVSSSSADIRAKA